MLQGSSVDILIVEDHAETRLIIERNLREILPGLLSTDDLEIVKTASKQEVQEKLPIYRFKLAVLDLNLPEREGGKPTPEVGDSVAKLLSQKDIPTLMVTSSELSKVHEDKNLKIIQRTQRQFHKRDLGHFEAFRVSLLETLYQQDKDEKISHIIEHTNDVAAASLLFQLRGHESFRGYARRCQADMKTFSKVVVKRSAGLHFGSLDWRSVLMEKTFKRAEDTKTYVAKDISNIQKYLSRWIEADENSPLFSQAQVHSDLGFLNSIQVKPVAVILELGLLLSILEASLKSGVMETMKKRQITSLCEAASVTLKELRLIQISTLNALIDEVYAVRNV